MAAPVSRQKSDGLSRKIAQQYFIGRFTERGFRYHPDWVFNPVNIVNTATADYAQHIILP
jgi:hypothetical protein